jgi:hypothetical protein
MAPPFFYQLHLTLTEVAISEVEVQADFLSDAEEARMFLLGISAGPVHEISSVGDPRSGLKSAADLDRVLVAIRDECPGILVWMIDAADTQRAEVALSALLEDRGPDQRPSGDGAPLDEGDDPQAPPGAEIAYALAICDLARESVAWGSSILIVGTATEVDPG